MSEIPTPPTTPFDYAAQSVRAEAEVALEKDGYLHADRVAILDGTPVSAVRAARAKAVLQHYDTLISSRIADGSRQSLETLLTDLMHWCAYSDPDVKWIETLYEATDRCDTEYWTENE